jgi:hypothetical protein
MGKNYENNVNDFCSLNNIVYTCNETSGQIFPFSRMKGCVYMLGINNYSAIDAAPIKFPSSLTGITFVLNHQVPAREQKSVRTALLIPIILQTFLLPFPRALQFLRSSRSSLITRSPPQNLIHWPYSSRRVHIQRSICTHLYRTLRRKTTISRRMQRIWD